MPLSPFAFHLLFPPPVHSSSLPTTNNPTSYGAGDSFGSGNCNTATAACGFYNNPGYNAAISQAVFGVGPGAGAGPACGTCYKLMPDGGSSIVVKINNLCPDDGNPLCSYPESKSFFLFPIPSRFSFFFLSGVPPRDIISRSRNVGD